MSTDDGLSNLEMILLDLRNRTGVESGHRMCKTEILGDMLKGQPGAKTEILGNMNLRAAPTFNCGWDTLNCVVIQRRKEDKVWRVHFSSDVEFHACWRA